MKTKSLFLSAALAALISACGDGDPVVNNPDAGSPDAAAAAEVGSEAGAGDATAAFPQTLFATENETMVAIDLATGMVKAGTITNVAGATDMQALESGHIIVNLGTTNETLIVDGRTFTEVARVKSSDIGAVRPVHGYITPKINGKQYWVANNDGMAGVAASNSIRFIDLTPGPTFLKAVGEVAVGIGHHKNAYSPAKARVSVSNIADCNNVITVVDYSDATKPTVVKAFKATDIDPARDCAMRGAGPHGGAAASNGHGYHNLTGWGGIAAVDQDSDAPTVKFLPALGAGAGYTKSGGRYVYSLQRTPREGDAMKPGKDCQIGNLVVVDSTTDTIASEVPLLYSGGACTTKLPATATLAGPDNTLISHDGKLLFVAVQAEMPMGSTSPAFGDVELVLDLTDPAKPVQKESIKVGSHSGHRVHRLSGDGKLLFVANNNDKTISQVDTATLQVVRTIPLKGTVSQFATFGSVEGPSAQVGPH